MVDEVKAVLAYLKTNNCEQKFPTLVNDVNLLRTCCVDFLHYKRKFDYKDCTREDLNFVYWDCAEHVVSLKAKAKEIKDRPTS
jgi:hypothetical protein